jgi:hypothetical protein
MLSIREPFVYSPKNGSVKGSVTSINTDESNNNDILKIQAAMDKASNSLMVSP